MKPSRTCDFVHLWAFCSERQNCNQELSVVVATSPLRNIINILMAMLLLMMVMIMITMIMAAEGSCRFANHDVASEHQMASDTGSHWSQSEKYNNKTVKLPGHHNVMVFVLVLVFVLGMVMTTSEDQKVSKCY